MRFPWPWRRADPPGWGHLRPGRWYRVAEGFTDHDGVAHAAGQHWRFLRHGFLPAEDGLTLAFATDGGRDRVIRLQYRPEAEGSVIDRLPLILPELTFPRGAFATLVGVDAGGIHASDGASRWGDIRRVSVAWGRQTYDATPCLTITRRGGRDVFLPLTERLAGPFLDGFARHLPGALPQAAWQARLDAGAAVVPIWPPTR